MFYLVNTETKQRILKSESKQHLVKIARESLFSWYIEEELPKGHLTTTTKKVKL